MSVSVCMCVCDSCPPGEGNLMLYATFNPFLLNKICLNQIVLTACWIYIDSLDVLTLSSCQSSFVVEYTLVFAILLKFENCINITKPS